MTHTQKSTSDHLRPALNLNVNMQSSHFLSFTRLLCWVAPASSSNPVLKVMWPEGKLSITEVTKRPLTAATLFKNSMISLVENLASKVRRRPPRPEAAAAVVNALPPPPAGTLLRPLRQAQRRQVPAAV